MTWIKFAIQAVGAVLAGGAAYLGAELAADGEPEQVGVKEEEIQNPIITIVNSTNIRLGELADQHNQHKEAVIQLFIAGAVILLIVILFNVILCCVVCRNKQKKSGRKGGFDHPL